MVARLWWKDLRQFWPIWALIAALALAIQPLLIRYGDEVVRQGPLASFALGWTCLYAYAVAAAAFAGERENRTLGWLDAVAASRNGVWLAKSSFALASTAALGMLLFAAATFSTERWATFGFWQALLTGTPLLLVILGFGLLWSAVLGNALLAAVLSVGTSLCALPMLQERLLNADVPRGLQFLLALTAAAMGWFGSWFLFVRTGPPRNALFLRRSSPPARDVASRPLAAPTTAPYHGPAFRSLVWQTWREARALLGWLLLVGVVIPPVSAVLFGRAIDFGVWAGANLLVSLVAGISAFGNDLRMGTNRLLAHHGARPSLIWLVRISVWFVVVLFVAAVSVTAMFCSSAFFRSLSSAYFGPLAFHEPRAAYEASWILCAAGLSFGIPVLSGMVIRRGITAGVVAILLCFLAFVPLGMLHAMGLLSWPVLLLLPLPILGVSLAWSGDWLVERPGWMRWLRLAGWCLGLGAALFATYVTIRAREVPRIDPSQEARLLGREPARIPDEDNAAPLYRQAVQTMLSYPGPVADLDRGGPIPLNEDLIAWLRANQDKLALLRRAASKPACRFRDLTRTTVFSGWDPSDAFPTLPLRLLDVSVRDQLARGDLDGAWKDIEAHFRISAHYLNDGTLQANTGLTIERQGLRLAMVWATHEKQTGERLRAASWAYRGIYPHLKQAIADPIRAEARILRNTEELPRNEIREKTLETFVQSRKDLQTADELRVEAMTTPWELARVSRAWRIVLGWYADRAGREPWNAAFAEDGNRGFPIGPSGTPGAPPLVDWILRTTPLLGQYLPAIDPYLVQWDRNEVGRRALKYILAIRVWQVEHGGKLPERLGQILEPGFMAELISDPYFGDSFRYVPATGQSLLPLDDGGILARDPRWVQRVRPVRTGYLLYSIGPDGKDDQALLNDNPSHGGDIIFPLPGPPH